MGYPLTANAILRPARIDEAEGLYVLQRETTLSAYAHIFPPELYPFPEEFREQWWKRLRNQGPWLEVIVAEVDGELCGVVVARPDRLESLYVRPDQWGGGIGGALHDAALDFSRRDNAPRCRLEVLEENERARRFYERRGWRQRGWRERAPFPPNPVLVGYVIEL